MIDIEVRERSFFLPEDGDVALAAFLDLLHAPGETYLAAYGFTLQPLFDEIEYHGSVLMIFTFRIVTFGAVTTIPPVTVLFS